MPLSVEFFHLAISSVLRLGGSLDRRSILRLRQSCDQVRAQSWSHLTVDLCRVEFIDRHSIGLLDDAAAALLDSGGTALFLVPEGQVRLALEAFPLTRAIQLAPAREPALYWGPTSLVS